MIGLRAAKKIINSIPEDEIFNFPHEDVKLVTEYAFEDEEFYVFNVFMIPKSKNFNNMTERQKKQRAFISWRVSKISGLPEEWVE